jgi:1,4-dihydroxy-2-naphthoate octaprenyltransferase
VSDFRAWVHAARPKTLPAAMAPVVVASALAWYDGVLKLSAAAWCLCFALLAQIAANFINDFLDFKSGIDTEERIGPARAVASGWITPHRMLLATAVAVVLAVACGLQLIPYTYLGWKLVWVGGLSILFCGLYSPLSRYGLGDLFVLVFFGLLPSVFTYFVQANRFSFPATILLGMMMGLLSINILIANNYRDYDTDKNVGKRTSIVIFGKKFGRIFYLCTGVAVCLFNFWLFYLKGNFLFGFIAWLFFIPHFRAWKTLVRIGKGKDLNVLLALSSGNLLLFCLLEILSFAALRWIQ